MSLATLPNEIASLGYVRVHTVDLEGWEQFGAGLLGLQPVRGRPGELAFRMDDAAHRLTLSDKRDDAPLCFGWEVRGPAALDSLAARIEASGRRARALTASEAERRGIAAGMAVTGPLRQPIRIFSRSRPRGCSIRVGASDLGIQNRCAWHGSRRVERGAHR